MFTARPTNEEYRTAGRDEKREACLRIVHGVDGRIGITGKQGRHTSLSYSALGLTGWTRRSYAGLLIARNAMRYSDASPCVDDHLLNKDEGDGEEQQADQKPKHGSLLAAHYTTKE